MQIWKRSAWIGLVLTIASPQAWADDKLTEQNMTQRDYQRLTETETSVEGEPAAGPPTPVHNLSDADENRITELGGAKVISAKDWKKESPTQRDAHIRRIRATIERGARLVVSVPKGEVWLIPDLENADETSGNLIYDVLIIGSVLRPWSEAERAALPRTVARDKSISQSDKHGTTQVRAQPVAAGEP